MKAAFWALHSGIVSLLNEILLLTCILLAANKMPWIKLLEYKLILIASRLLFTLILLLGISCAEVDASTYVTGDLLPIVALEDQYDELIEINDTARAVLFSRDMLGSHVIGDAISALGQDKAIPIYFADIQAMPSLVAHFFAVPKMQSLSYRIGLDRDGLLTKNFPAVEDSASLLLLDKRRVVSVQFFSSSEALTKVLKNLPVSNKITPPK